MAKEIGTVTVSPGSLVTGRYKRANRDSKVIKLSVDRCLVVPDRFGNAVPYLAGTRLDGAQAGMVMAVRADCFNPNELDVTGDTQFEALGGFYYVNGNADPMFGFYEHIETDVDVELCLERGGHPAEDFTVPALEIPVAVEAEIAQA